MKPVRLTRALLALVGGSALALPAGGAYAAASPRAAPGGGPPKTMKYTGATVPAHQWGSVTVIVTQQSTATGNKVTRRFTDLGGGYTYHTARSKLIMSQALPLLRQEFLTAQSARIQLVSGATYTSQAFIRSLQSALHKAPA